MRIYIQESYSKGVMKKTITYILYILVLCAVVACDNGDREIVEPMYDKVVFNAVADSPSTRTALIFGGGKYQATWKTGDTFRIVQIANGEKSVYSGTVAEDCLRLSSIAEFETKIADEYVYLFGYPTLSMNSLCTYVAFTLPAEQNPTTIDTFDGNADMLLSECVVRKSQPIGESIRFNIKRLSSIGKFTVKNLALAEGDKVKSVTFSCTKPISGKITNLQLSDLMAGDISIKNSTFVEDQNYNYVKVSLAEPQSEEFTYYMSCWPTILAAGEQYTIVIETEQDEYVKTATLPFDLVFEQNEITTLTVNMAGVVAKNAAPATYKILYTSTDGNVVTPYKTNVFGANIVSNTYENGQGVITFDAEVTSIGEKAFYNRSKLASITFPNSATLIGDFAFTECSSLTSVTIQNGVTSIGKSAFYLCSKLSYITIPESVTSFGDYVFKACYDLLSITIPESVTSIGQEAFYSCSSLTNATIPDSVTKIGDGTFQNCSNLATVTIGSGVTSIGERAFYNCSNLASVTIPDSVTKIESEAFYGCSSITSAVISNSLTSINSSMFYNCSSLTTVTIPNSITSISHSAFYGCSSLTSVTIPSNVTSLGYDAFYKCSNLKDVYCKPTTPPTLGHDVFYNNATDRKIYVPAAAVDTYKTATNWSSYADAIVAEEGSSDENRKIYYTSTDGKVVTPYKTNVFGANIVSNTYENGQGVITFDGTVTSIGDYAFLYCGTLTSVTIPDSVTSIGNGAFANCGSLQAFYGKFASSDNRCLVIDGVLNSFAPSGLTSYTIPASITSIGYSTFYNCSSLISVTIGNSVTSIRDNAFRCCGSLTSVTIPDSVTSIGNTTFYSCRSLTSVTIGNSVTSIGDSTFKDCSSLTSVYCKPLTPPSLYTEVFENNATDRKFYVPAESLDAYKTASRWRLYADAIEVDPESVVEVDLSQYTDLSAEGTANCYLVKSAGNYKLKAVKGNSTTSVGDAQSASVLWETFGTATTPNVGDLVTSAGYQDGYVYFSTPTNFANGNASIAVHDANNTILWSWHIWCSAEGWSDHVYANNAGTMMDRNLGATSAMPGNVGALGLLYQWGRKDPFLSSSSISASTDAASTIIFPSAVTSTSATGTIEYATSKPTTFIIRNAGNSDWYYTGDSSTDNTRWMESEKTMYDPCPVGYRVPKGDVSGFWSTALGTSSSTSEGTTWDDTNKGRHWTLADGTTAWYPAVGYRYYDSGALVSVGSYGYYWSASPNPSSSSRAYTLSFSYGNVFPADYYNRGHGQSVRCVRE